MQLHEFYPQVLEFYSRVLEWVGLGGVYCRFRFNLLLFLALCTCTLHLKQITSCIKCTLLSNGATRQSRFNLIDLCILPAVLDWNLVELCLVST